VRNAETCALYDHREVRRWRSLDTCQLRAILHAAPPADELAGARRPQRETALGRARKPLYADVRAVTIDWMLATSQKAVGEQLHLSWTWMPSRK
jgi:hypothetical protein